MPAPFFDRRPGGRASPPPPSLSGCAEVIMWNDLCCCMMVGVTVNGESVGYGDGTQGRHELRPVISGPELYGGFRAGMLIDPQGVTVFDTQGIDRFSLEMPPCGACGVGGDRQGDCGCPAAEKVRQAYLRWERMHCSECGTRVWEGAMFCRECRPYGFWHWLEYFSPVAWRRIRADRSPTSTSDEREERTG